MKNKLFNILIIVCAVALVASGVYSATKTFPNRGGTGQDTSNWTGCPIITNGTWSTTTCAGTGSGMMRDWITTNLPDMYATTSATAVGIGLTTPTSTLDIRGTAGINPLNIASSTGTSLFSIQQDGIVDIAGTLKGGKTGGLWGVNVETLSGDKTLTPGTDVIYQYLDEGGADRDIFLATTTASIGDRFVIQHNGHYADIKFLEIFDGSTSIEKLWSGSIREWIFNGTNWVSTNGFTNVGDSSEPKFNISIGVNAKAYDRGVAIGFQSQANSGGVSIGSNSSDGAVRGVAIGGGTPTGNNNGVAVGYSSKAKDFSVAVGSNAGHNQGNYKVSLGYFAGNTETTDYRLHIDISNRTDSLIYGEFDNRIVKINGDLVLPNGGAGSAAANTIRLKAKDLSAGDAGLHIKTENDTEYIFASKAGFGTTTPSTTLGIVGTAGTDLLDIASSTGTSLFYITQAGFVGIGIASPSSILHLVDGSLPTITFGVNGILETVGSFIVNLDSDDNLTTQSFTVSHNATGLGGTELFRVQEDGNVGIGTTTPTTKLWVEGTTTITDDLDFHSAGSGLFYGSVYGNELNWTQASAVQDTWYVISDSDMATGQLNNMTHDGNGQLTALSGGIYKANWSGSFEANATGVHFQVTFMMNGTTTPDSMNHFETFGTSKEQAVSGHAILNIPTNATTSVAIRTTDGGTPNFLVDHLSITLTKIGGN